MNNNFNKELLKKISSVPGLIGLSNVDFTLPNIILQKNKLHYGFSLTKTFKGVDIVIAIIVVFNIRSKFVVELLLKTIKNVFYDNNIKLNSINIYIRGVK